MLPTGAKACRYKSAETVVKFLLSIFVQHGPPKEIRCDILTEFTAKVVKEVSHKWSVKMRYTAPYSPASNGKAERTNYTLVKKLVSLLSMTKNGTKFWIMYYFAI